MSCLRENFTSSSYGEGLETGWNPIPRQSFTRQVFYRAAKQELGLSNCHSTTEIHHHAHLELLFAAETLLNYARWYENKEKTSDGECFTHGEMVSSLFHTRCQIQLKAHKGIQQVHIKFDTTVCRFARLFESFWPDEIRMFWGKD